MPIFKIDLHIHSVLSPCSDLLMSPSRILDRASEVGLDIIAISDHNMAENGKALAELKVRNFTAPECFFGMELQTEEEVHLLCLFEAIDTAMIMQEEIYPLLISQPNNPDLFGYQIVVDEFDEIIRHEEKLLISSVMLRINDVFKKVTELEGIVIPSHIDKESFSIISQLGFIPSDIPFPTVELSRNADINSFMNDPSFADLNLVTFSDSHRIEEIGSAWTEIELEDRSFACFKEAISMKSAKPFKIRRSVNGYTN